MNRVNIQNLALEITNKCNLDCENCINKNEDNNITMSPEIIDSIFSQINKIDNLYIYGGEPTLVLNKLYYLFRSVVNYHVTIDQLDITINGSHYTEEFIKLLDYMNLYGKISGSSIDIKLNILRDDHHKQTLRRLGIYQEALANIKKYMESKYFNSFEKQPRIITKASNYNETFITYTNGIKGFNSIEKLCNIGPLITINPNGTVTECDYSIEEQDTLYNYGNVLEESIESVSLKKGKRVSRITWYYETNRTI